MAAIEPEYRPLSSLPITGRDHGHTNGFRQPAVPPYVLDMAKGATTSDSGIPGANDEPSLIAGPIGPTPLQDAYLVQEMRYFNRDRSPSGGGPERR